jgi:hypothetical protein
MKAALLLAIACLSCATLHAWVAVLDTPHFRLEIEHACEEGCVSCDQVHYRATNKKTKQAISLIGSTVHTMGADGKTPSHFLGYRFTDGSTVYFVSDDGHLEVTQQGKLLLREQGVWESEKKKPNQSPEPTAPSGRGSS